MLGRPLVAQRKEEQRVQNAETAIKEAGSVAHRRGKLQRGYAWRARDVLRLTGRGVKYPSEPVCLWICWTSDRAGDKGSHFSRYGPEPVIQ
jgi:hypothetical protein